MSIFKQGKYSHTAMKKRLMQRQKLLRKQHDEKCLSKANMWITAVAIFLVIVISTALFLWGRGFIAQKQFERLAENIHGTQTDETVVIPITSKPTAEDEMTRETAMSTVDTTYPSIDHSEKVMLEKYVRDFERNPDFFGWIRMHGTTLDYPVMQARDGDNDKYLDKSFYGSYSASGVPFADVKCTRDSDNIIIFGHNLNDGTMFRPLFNYESEEYFEKNPTIMFSDLYNDYEYEVMSVFYDQIYKKSDTRFKYYQFIDADTEEDFDNAISELKEKSIYDTGIDAEHGDKLIMLITCSYHIDNGRFVVVARRKMS